MKHVFYAAAAVLVFAVAASAEVPAPISLYAGGLVSLPTSPEGFSDNYKTGFHGTIGVGYDVAPTVQLVGKLEYHRFAVDFDANPMLAAEDVSGGHNNLLMFGADARWSLNVPAFPLKPFLLGGIGLARLSATDFEGTSDLVAGLNDVQPDPETDFYFNLGGGVDLATSPLFGLFAQVRFVQVATEGESSSFIPITLGLKFF